MRALWFHLVLVLLVAVGGGAQAAAPVAPPVAAAAEGNTDFALRLYQQLRPRQGNLFFSPYSISLALAMTYAGARGNTEREMAQALSFRLPQDQLHPAFHALSEELASRAKDRREMSRDEGEPFRLHVANSLWGQKGHTFLPAFLDLQQREYGAGMRLVDFAQSEAARGTINRWVSDETQRKITDLIQRGLIDASTRLVLVNAIYFSASWEGRFETDRTAPGPFTLLDGQQVTVPLMHQYLDAYAAEGKDWQAVQLPYEGHKLAMVALVPAAGTLPQFEQSLTPDRLQEILSELKFQKVNVTLPRFGYTSSFRLDQALRALGMRNAFGNADFSGMDGKRDLAISAVVHKAMVKVDEKGTEATAATAVMLYLSASSKPPPDIKADRPFLFLIRDLPTGTILFMGRVVDPR
jgi:serpin B